MLMNLAQIFPTVQNFRVAHPLFKIAQLMFPNE